MCGKKYWKMFFFFFCLLFSLFTRHTGLHTEEQHREQWTCSREWLLPEKRRACQRNVGRLRADKRTNGGCCSWTNQNSAASAYLARSKINIYPQDSKQGGWQVHKANDNTLAEMLGTTVPPTLLKECPFKRHHWTVKPLKPCRPHTVLSLKKSQRFLHQKRLFHKWFLCYVSIEPFSYETHAEERRGGSMNELKLFRCWPQKTSQSLKLCRKIINLVSKALCLASPQPTKSAVELKDCDSSLPAADFFCYTQAEFDWNGLN